MTYKGINFCDECGQRLEDGQWLSGLCRLCEEAQKNRKRPVESVKVRKGLLQKGGTDA